MGFGRFLTAKIFMLQDCDPTPQQIIQPRKFIKLVWVKLQESALE
jgi:hypothetical protein